MARERSPDREKAEKMYLDSGGEMKLKDIAATLGLGDTQIRKWKSIDKWDEKLKGNVTNDARTPKSNVTKRKPGAPPGNKFAVGNNGGPPKGSKNALGNRGGDGGPPGNKKAVTTGEYETIWLDTLEEDERQLVQKVDTDPTKQADDEITLLTIRERRMMQRIQKLTNGLTEKQRRVLQERRTVKDVMSVHDEKSGQTKTVAIPRDELVIVEIEETEFRPIEDILKLEEALTRVQDKKLKAIELKQRLKDSGGGGGNEAQSWVAAMDEVVARRKAKVNADE
ncbi:terminase [Paenibacillus mesophilus]|uniref:phage terminase small subunit n=1 Tax=Paenibacillus mesophilus TaxID=2582849 RepID=UPI00110DCEAE|nr:phage terminase small subunit [Paenibacillus mesophilus]TMV49374.1 terminase [Paenibacillus mesophilus]